MELITIRTARQQDLPLLLDFEQKIINAERPFDVTIKDGDCWHYYDIEWMIGAPEVEVVVAEAGGEIVASGYARIKTAEIYFRHPKYAYLGFMYTAPNHRGKGVNKKVLKHLVDWSRSQGIDELRLEVYNDNLPALKAYEKIGFKKLLTEMRVGINEINS
jgi:ribosomal protein S18 acetylase RimI-like enzyme